jgi:protein-disulfide isomerase
VAATGAATPYIRIMAAIDRRTLISLGLAVAAGAGVSSWLRSRPPEGVTVDDTPVRRAVLGDPGSPRSGAARPDLTVVVFTDYLCGICKQTDPAVRRLIDDDPGVGVIWKDWPIRGPDAEAAARVALAAHWQDIYDPVHDALMAARGALTPDRARAIAQDAGADGARLAADLATHDAAIRNQLARHAGQAFGLGLVGTPAYLVGPFLHQGALDDGPLRGAIKAARRAL